LAYFLWKFITPQYCDVNLKKIRSCLQQKKAREIPPKEKMKNPKVVNLLEKKAIKVVQVLAATGETNNVEPNE